MSGQNTEKSATVHVWRWILVGCSVLVAVRVLQLLSYVHYLYGFEFAQLGQLAFEIHKGYPIPDNLTEFLGRYQYGRFAQGTVFVSVGAAMFSEFGLGPTIWSLHAVAITCEALTFLFFFLIVCRQTQEKMLRLLAAGLWICVPTFAAMWQLLPYGNHTNMLWLPMALCLFVTGDQEQRKWYEWFLATGIVAVSIILYRLNGAACIAFGITFLFYPNLKVKMKGGSVTFIGIVLAFVLIWLAGPEVEVRPPSVGEDFTLNFVRIWKNLMEFLPAAPYQNGLLQIFSRTLFLAAIPFGLIVCFRKDSPSVRMTRFGFVWAILALVLVANTDSPAKRYFLPGFYALLLAWIGILLNVQRRWSRVLVSASVFYLVVVGVVDTKSLIRPEGFKITRGYDGFRLWRNFALTNFDIDELPFYKKMEEEGVSSHWVGFASRTMGNHWAEPMLVVANPSIPSPDQELFFGGSEGWLAEAIQSHQKDEPGNPPNLSMVGRGVWIVCQRDLDCVRRSIHGLPEHEFRLVTEGALAESTRWRDRVVATATADR